MITQIGADAREARDLARDLKTILQEQNAPQRIVELRAEMKVGDQDLRVDLVHAQTQVRTEMREANALLTERIDTVSERTTELEADQQRRHGGHIIFRLMRDFSALLISAGAALIALLSFQATHHP
jgi:hypothetical protein